MPVALSAFLSGLLFGLGLIISEMVNPKRVQGFLDVTGQWDPTLIFVIGGALVVTGLGYRLIFKSLKPLFSETFVVSTNRVVDAKLAAGAAIFGIGWGLSGLCPGPAVVGISTGNLSIIIFVIAMLAGMKIFERVAEKI